jgi:hypothetical protein
VQSEKLPAGDASLTAGIAKFQELGGFEPAVEKQLRWRNDARGGSRPVVSVVPDAE